MELRVGRKYKIEQKATYGGDCKSLLENGIYEITEYKDRCFEVNRVCDGKQSDGWAICHYHFTEINCERYCCCPLRTPNIPLEIGVMYKGETKDNPSLWAVGRLDSISDGMARLIQDSADDPSSVHTMTIVKTNFTKLIESK